MRISDWSSDVCSSDLEIRHRLQHRKLRAPVRHGTGQSVPPCATVAPDPSGSGRNVKPKMKTLQRLELLKDLVQQAVDRGASSVEAIHQQIAALPFEMLEKAGLLDDDKLRLRDKQQRTIGPV